MKSFSALRPCLAALGMMAAAVFTACSSDDAATAPKTTPEETPKTCILTVEATKKNDLTRALSITSQSGQPDVLNARWAANEKVAVLKWFGHKWELIAKLTPENISADGLSCNLTGEVSTTTTTNNDNPSTSTTNDNPSTTNDNPSTAIVGAGDKLRLVYPYQDDTGYRIDYTNQDGTIQKVSSSYDYCSTPGVLKDAVTVTEIRDNILHTTPATFTNHQAIVCFHLTDKNGNKVSTTDLTISVKDNSGSECMQLQQTLTGEAASAPVGSAMTVTRSASSAPYYVALPGFSDKTINLIATLSGTTYFYEKSGVTFTNGKFYDIEVRIEAYAKKSMDQLTSSDFGWVIGSDGYAYQNKLAVPGGVTPLAVTGSYSYDAGTLYAFALEDVVDGEASTFQWFDWLYGPNPISNWASPSRLINNNNPWRMGNLIAFSTFFDNNDGNALIVAAGGTPLTEEYWMEDTNSQQNVGYYNISTNVASYAPKTDYKKVRPVIEIYPANY